MKKEIEKGFIWYALRIVLTVFLVIHIFYFLGGYWVVYLVLVDLSVMLRMIYSFAYFSFLVFFMALSLIHLSKYSKKEIALISLGLSILSFLILAVADWFNIIFLILAIGGLAGGILIWLYKIKKARQA